jgi:hypothetical protein
VPIKREEKQSFLSVAIFFCSLTDWCVQTGLPTPASLSLPVYVEPGLSEWCSPLAGLHPRQARAGGLVQYFAGPQRATKSTTTTEPAPAPAPAPEATADAHTHTNVSYIDPRWNLTYLITRKCESAAELYTRCEEFLRVRWAYLRPGSASVRCSPGWCRYCSFCVR